MLSVVQIFRFTFIERIKPHVGNDIDTYFNYKSMSFCVSKVCEKSRIERAVSVARKRYFIFETVAILDIANK